MRNSTITPATAPAVESFTSVVLGKGGGLAANRRNTSKGKMVVMMAPLFAAEQVGTACGVRVVVYSTAVGWITSAGAGAGAGAVLGSKMSGKVSLSRIRSAGSARGTADAAALALAAITPISGLVPTTACARALLGQRAPPT